MPTARSLGTPRPRGSSRPARLANKWNVRWLRAPLSQKALFVSARSGYRRVTVNSRMHRISIAVTLAGIRATAHLALVDPRAARPSDQARADPEADQPL